MSESPADDRRASDRDDLPPLGSWPRLYGLVLATDALMIVLFTLFTFYFE